MQNPKFRQITLRLDNGKILSWNPLDISEVEFHRNYIKINDIIIEKKDTYYPHWNYFILQLTRIFELERFEIIGKENEKNI